MWIYLVVGLIVTLSVLFFLSLGRAAGLADQRMREIWAKRRAEDVGDLDHLVPPP